MKESRWIVGDTQVSEVKTFMEERDCSRCFGCPTATILASSAISLAKLDHARIDKESELEVLTRNCIGYSDERPVINPSEMCQSPVDDTNRISILAGKFIDLVRLRFRDNSKI